MIHIKIISFTNRGVALGCRLRDALDNVLVQVYARSSDLSLRFTELRRFSQQAMFDCDSVIFIGATGIAVRSVAPFLRGKNQDPAILVLDEHGHYVVPLLSGHLGGANALAEKIATAIGAFPVITTATDINDTFAVDVWAKDNDFLVYEIHRIRCISAALLRGEFVGLQSDFPVRDDVLPQGILLDTKTENGVVLSVRTDASPFSNTLHLVPRRAVWVGIGCRKGIAQDTLERALKNVLDAEQIPNEALCGFATIERKAYEPGLCALAHSYSLPVKTFTADQLRGAEGIFTPSTFVQETVGVDNVCERAAILASNGILLRRKTVQNGVTVSLAVERREVNFVEYSYDRHRS